MKKEEYIKSLEQPHLITSNKTIEVKQIVEKHPYFQSARALYLKALKNQESYKYNNELKITAAHTSNRTVLFDFITSKSFKDHQEKEEKLSLKEVLFSKKKATEKSIIEKELAIGKPLAFDRNESFSFNQWLQLSTQKIIDRTENSTEKIVPEKEQPVSEQDDIINRFIENSPKISRPNKNASNDFKVKETQQSSQLMTETLAKVYLEQKKYDSAIQAYKILSLKYPEKSGFFADQIKRIQILQKN
ncbi:hypothetical protein WH52_11980 [Tenacibaculum holothuriorum]|uniref:Tetratricopeptide repeat protein n=1 Tax=Tenacibaculum holothuriorum TaxID=1635173 RepID=A0A1Y2PAA0_9FLAO|nr:hypothetical protein WH52_11980 [Tenacibaculum holothuriorum]